MDWFDRLQNAGMPGWLLAILGFVVVMARPIFGMMSQRQRDKMEAMMQGEMVSQADDLGEGWLRLVKTLEKRVDMLEGEVRGSKRREADCQRRLAALEARCAACRNQGAA
jgi:hypothetical protein